MRRFKRLTLILVPLLLLTAGCGGKRREDPIMRLSAAEALEMGKQLLAQEKYYKAGQHLTHAFEVEPNSREGREALLLAADALYLNGGSDNYIRCEAKYRDFLNRFPTSERSDYAQFRVADCLARRVEKPDRDQQVTKKALEAYQELLRLYPTSQYVPEARQQIQEVVDLLASHELIIGSFYLRYGRGALCFATIERLEYLLEEYPTFSQMDAVYYQLGVAYDKCRRPKDSLSAFQDLLVKYPESGYVGELEKRRKKGTRQQKKQQKKQQKNDGAEEG